MNLSNIKKVGFIPNFNPNKGYPEFGKKASITSITSIIRVKPVKEPSKRLLAIKEAKKSYKNTVKSKPKSFKIW